MMQVDINLYNKIAEYGFSSKNPGYKPLVQESPNGDGVWDTEKVYAHIATKYFTESTPPYVLEFYNQAIEESIRVCKELEISKEFYPGKDSTLRILRYPPGATTASHLDFDFFTISPYLYIVMILMLSNTWMVLTKTLTLSMPGRYHQEFTLVK